MPYELCQCVTQHLFDYKIISCMSRTRELSYGGYGSSDLA